MAKPLRLLELRFMLIVLRYLAKVQPDRFLNSESEKLQKDLSLAVEEEYREMGLSEPPSRECNLSVAS